MDDGKLPCIDAFSLADRFDYSSIADKGCFDNTQVDGLTYCFNSVLVISISRNQTLRGRDFTGSTI